MDHEEFLSKYVKHTEKSGYYIFIDGVWDQTRRIKNHGLTLKQYYDKFVSCAGYCKYCGKRTKFLNIVKGYADYCSEDCWNRRNEYLIGNKYSGFSKNSGISRSNDKYCYFYIINLYNNTIKIGVSSEHFHLNRIQHVYYLLKIKDKEILYKCKLLTEQAYELETIIKTRYPTKRGYHGRFHTEIFDSSLLYNFIDEAYTFNAKSQILTG